LIPSSPLDHDGLPAIVVHGRSTPWDQVDSHS
jgi:hypothetical protein